MDPLLIASAERRLARLAQLEHTVLMAMLQPWRLHLPDVSRDIEAYFVREFGLPAEVPLGTHISWDRVAAARAQTVPTLMADLRDRLAATIAEQEAVLADARMAAFVEGYYSGLYDLYQSGVDVEDGLPAVPALLKWLAVGGFAGLTMGQRLKGWADTATDKVGRWLKAAVAGGLSLTDTTTVVDRAMTQAQQGTLSLAGDEIHLVGATGTHAAYAQYGRAIRGEMWVTKRDERVCRICGPKHLTETWEQPVTHSHPGCRCVKIPIPYDITARPLAYESFLRAVRAKYPYPPEYQGGEYWRTNRWSRNHVGL